MTGAHGKTRAVLVMALYILGLGLLQTTLLSRLLFFGSAPDLILVLTILAGYMFGSYDGAVIGLSAGFFRDLLAGRALGLGMLLMMYMAILASVLFRKFFRRNILLGLVQILLLTLLYESLISLLSFIVPMLPDVSLSLPNLLAQKLRTLPGHLLANMLAGIPLIFFLHFLGPFRRGSRKEGQEDSIVGDSVWRVN